MTVLLRRALGSCAVLAACAGIGSFYGSYAHIPAEPAHAEMTVVPVRNTSRTASAHAHPAAHGRNLLSGIASWYGDVFDGRLTANGEVFDQQAMTACHKTLPFGTLVRVINLRNRHSVVVRINDRGILTPDRIIDLSSAAAGKLGMLRRGTAPVRLEIVSVDDPSLSTKRPG